MKTLFEALKSSMGTETIFTIVKPGFLDRTEDILLDFKEEGWEIVKTTVKTLTMREAKELYKIHKDEQWYDSLCEYMSSGPSRVIMFERPGQQDKGTYESVAKLKDSIRKKWGIDDCRNVMHSSDSMSAMEHELRFYF